jgi:membrane dipeptidase
MRGRYIILGITLAVITFVSILFARLTTPVNFELYTLYIPNIASYETRQDADSITYEVSFLKFFDQEVINIDELNVSFEDINEENMVYFKDNSQYGVKIQKDVTDWFNEYKIIFTKKEELKEDFYAFKDVGFFDLHADVLFDVLDKSTYLKDDIIQYHLDEQKKGSIAGGFWMLYFPKNYDYDINLAVDVLTRKLDQNEDLMDRNIILGFEGLGKIESLEHLEVMYHKGFKVASITWNDVNKWGTGTFTGVETGLTEDGVRLVKRMEELGMIIDVSHANEQTFYDIYENTTGVLIASHSNVDELASSERNLSDDQIRKIASRNGVVGITTIKHYISKDTTKQNLEGMIDHIDYIVDLVGIEHVSIGFDFVDYLDDSSNIDEVKDESLAYRVIGALKRRGYSDEEIDLIMYKNIYRVMNEVFGTQY